MLSFDCHARVTGLHRGSQRVFIQRPAKELSAVCQNGVRGEQRSCVEVAIRRSWVNADVVNIGQFRVRSLQRAG